MVKIEIFASPNCEYCERAKVLLRSKGFEFQEFDVSQDSVRALFKERLPRVKSVPQIFIAGEHIGGFEDLQYLDRNGELDGLLTQLEGTQS